MKIGALKQSGHAPSLLSAFLHFDISFMVWVILGALMPFIIADAGLTGESLRITPTAEVTHTGQYTLLIKRPQATSQNPRLLSNQPSDVYNLLIKPGDPSAATRNTVKPVETHVLNNRDPQTIARLNATSQLIRVSVSPDSTGNPNENVFALKTRGELSQSGAAFQPVASGYPAAVKLTLIAVPLLAAGFWRLLLGVLVDRLGSKRVGTASLLLTFVPLIAGWQFGTNYNSLLFIGFFLGLAGASFAVSLPLASRWYPPHLQGLAMGIAGAGNSGTVLATIFAPLLAKTLGWHAVFGLMMIPVGMVLIVFTILAKDPPSATGTRSAGFREYVSVLTQADAWWFCLLYFVTFGGFVGLSSFLNTFFVDQFDAPRAAVGLWTWPFIIAGSLLRPIGGALADRLGGIRMLTLLYGAVIAAAAGVGAMISNFPVVGALLFILMGCLGMGNGSVFQLVPQRFGKEIGVMTGLVGAAGGVGGYYLNFALGHLHTFTGSYAAGFWAFAAIAAVALAALRATAPSWTRSWLNEGGIARTTTPTISGHVIERELAGAAVSPVSPELA